MTVQDLSSRRLPTIEIDYGAAYELLITLIVFKEEKGFDYEVGSEWFDAVRDKAGADLLADINTFQLEDNHIWVHLLGLAYDSKPPRDVPALIAHIETAEPLELRLHLIGYYRRSFRRLTPLDVILQAAEGDPEAQRQYIKTSTNEHGHWQDVLHHLFSLDSEETKTRVLDILQ